MASAVLHNYATGLIAANERRKKRRNWWNKSRIVAVLVCRYQQKATAQVSTQTGARRDQLTATSECDIKVDLINPHPRQPRIDFEPEAITRLAASLKDPEIGLLQRILVRRKEDGRYELLAGERRLRAAKQAGWETIPAVVRVVTDRAALKILLLENLERADLNALETAFVLSELNRSVEDGGAGLSPRQIAKEFNRTVSWVNHKLALLNLREPWRSRLITGEINESQAAAVSRAEPDVQQAVEVARRENPEAFQTRDQWRSNVKTITQQMTGTAEPEERPKPNGPQKARSRPTRQETIPPTPPSEPSKRTRKTPPPVLERTLSDRDIGRLLKPYNKRRGDLVALRNRAQTLIDKLDERQTQSG